MNETKPLSSNEQTKTLFVRRQQFTKIAQTMEKVGLVALPIFAIVATLCIFFPPLASVKFAVLLSSGIIFTLGHGAWLLSKIAILQCKKKEQAIEEASTLKKIDENAIIIKETLAEIRLGLNPLLQEQIAIHTELKKFTTLIEMIQKKMPGASPKKEQIEDTQSKLTELQTRIEILEQEHQLKQSEINRSCLEEKEAASLEDTIRIQEEMVSYLKETKTLTDLFINSSMPLYEQLKEKTKDKCKEICQIATDLGISTYPFFAILSEKS
ncbi:MAG: hypothetical protein KGJ02_05645 [Verrucomicrobiota bacterium]|nr:hypothetical protein [Verrucomicrobiota bacterium]